MTCQEIRPGMEFEGPKGAIVKVLRQGTYTFDESGKRIPIDNHRRNKWWATDGGKEDLYCFDQEWDNEEKYHFRLPT